MSRVRTITIEYHFRGGESLIASPDLMADLVRLKVDVILAPGTAAVQAARKATTTIPIVACDGR